MSEQADEFEFHPPNHGEDDRPGLDEADDYVDDEEDEDEDDDEDDDEDEEDDDYPDDALIDDVDVAIALYREDGQPVSVPLELDLVNDLDALIDYLRRLPGDAGALAMISLAGNVFILVRVRGKTVQVYLSDDTACADWPIAHDIADYLGEDIPDVDDDPDSMGDGAILADVGLHEIDLDAITSDADEDTAVLLERVAAKVQFGPQLRAALDHLEL